ncbi:MAG: hypothetical protein L6V85_02695 [Clostridiales bacterium]|nr:MAG: hypothetical protein L6V85_02695 [Clostridiales bacterium]
MKKTVTIKDIDCAKLRRENRARSAKKSTALKSANLNFFGQRLQFECDEEDYERIAKRNRALCKESRTGLRNPGFIIQKNER